MSDDPDSSDEERARRAERPNSGRASMDDHGRDLWDFTHHRGELLTDKIDGLEEDLIQSVYDVVNRLIDRGTLQLGPPEERHAGGTFFSRVIDSYGAAGTRPGADIMQQIDGNLASNVRPWWKQPTNTDTPALWKELHAVEDPIRLSAARAIRSTTCYDGHAFRHLLRTGYVSIHRDSLTTAELLFHSVKEDHFFHGIKDDLRADQMEMVRAIIRQAHEHVALSAFHRIYEVSKGTATWKGTFDLVLDERLRRILMQGALLMEAHIEGMDEDERLWNWRFLHGWAAVMTRDAIPWTTASAKLHTGIAAALHRVPLNRYRPSSGMFNLEDISSLFRRYIADAPDSDVLHALNQNMLGWWPTHRPLYLSRVPDGEEYTREDAELPVSEVLRLIRPWLEANAAANR